MTAALSDVSAITMQEVVERREALRLIITDLVASFETVTGCVVDKIQVLHQQTLTERIAYRVELEVSLP